MYRGSAVVALAALLALLDDVLARGVLDPQVDPSLGRRVVQGLLRLHRGVDALELKQDHVVLALEVEYLVNFSKGFEDFEYHGLRDFLNSLVKYDEEHLVGTLFVLLLRMVDFESPSAENLHLLPQEHLWVCLKVLVAFHRLFHVFVLDEGELTIPDE